MLVSEFIKQEAPHSLAAGSGVPDGEGIFGVQRVRSPESQPTVETGLQVASVLHIRPDQDRVILVGFHLKDFIRQNRAEGFGHSAAGAQAGLHARIHGDFEGEAHSGFVPDKNVVGGVCLQSRDLPGAGRAALLRKKECIIGWVVPEVSVVPLEHISFFVIQPAE